jgi:hypothetical protein
MKRENFGMNGQITQFFLCLIYLYFFPTHPCPAFLTQRKSLPAFDSLIQPQMPGVIIMQVREHLVLLVQPGRLVYICQQGAEKF